MTIWGMLQRAHRYTPEVRHAPKKVTLPKWKVVFQESFLRGELIDFRAVALHDFEAHWQLSIKILYLNFHFPNAQFSLLRVYLEWGGNAVGQNFPQTTLEHMEIANPREPTKFHDPLPHSEDEWFETLKKHPWWIPTPPKNHRVPTWFSQLLVDMCFTPFCLANSFVASKPTKTRTPQGFFNLSKGHRLDQNRSNQLGLLDLPKYFQDGDLYLKNILGEENKHPSGDLEEEFDCWVFLLRCRKGGKGGSKGLFLGKMCVFLLAMVQEMTYFLDIVSE